MLAGNQICFGGKREKTCFYVVVKPIKSKPRTTDTRRLNSNPNPEQTFGMWLFL